MRTTSPVTGFARMGRRLLAFRDCNGWDTAALAAFLRCDAEGMVRLVFQPLPDADDVEAIAQAAATAGCDPDRLTRALDRATLVAPPVREPWVSPVCVGE